MQADQLSEEQTDTILSKFINYYASFQWPTEAHRLSCTGMFSMFIRQAGVNTVIQSLYRDGVIPDSNKRYQMWKECIKIRRLPLTEQQERLQTIHTDLEEKRKNPIKKGHPHPFIFREAPPSNMIAKKGIPTYGEWNIQDHVQGIQWEEEEILVTERMDAAKEIRKKKEEKRKKTTTTEQANENADL